MSSKYSQHIIEVLVQNSTSSVKQTQQATETLSQNESAQAVQTQQAVNILWIAGDAPAKITKNTLEVIVGVDHAEHISQLSVDVALTAPSMTFVSTEIVEVARQPASDAKLSRHIIEVLVSTSEESGAYGIIINAGDAATAQVGATVTVNAPSDTVSMRFRNTDRDWGEWLPVSDSYWWALEAGWSGTKTVYAQFLSGSGVVSETYSDTIELGVPAYALAQISEHWEVYGWN